MSIIIKYRSRVMPISTQLYQQAKAAEQFYYMMLFANDPDRAGTPIPGHRGRRWDCIFRSRCRPIRQRAMSACCSINPHGNELYVYKFTGGNRKNSERLKTLLTDIDRLRAELKGRDEGARLKAVRADPAVASRLIEPVEAALKQSGCGRQVRDQFEAAINRGLVALTWPEIHSVDIAIE